MSGGTTGLACQLYKAVSNKDQAEATNGKRAQTVGLPHLFLSFLGSWKDLVYM
jgi:hypothetical protein